MDEATKALLLKSFGALAVDAGIALFPVYGAAIARMGLKEATAFWIALKAGDYAASKAAVRAAMTPEELAAEKTELTKLGWQIAEDEAGRWDFFKAVLMTGLKVVLAMVLSLVAL